ncbi:hypothetical protein [Paraburkholderia panacisoli]|uniref:hypothetical protein n=1 Tax=Paraburkholderia panacisoli TaxID=2603818 RepID=UPI00165F13DE|nr:hypothetical protein [Paraburkholderia panacisoli]
MLKKTISGTAMTLGRVTYMLELARGSSHIASTRKQETLNLAIAEVLEGFSQLHGVPGLGVFRELLAQDVERRGNQGAASAVRSFDPREWTKTPPMLYVDRPEKVTVRSEGTTLSKRVAPCTKGQ